MQAPKTTDQNPKASAPLSLLRLPLELRRNIYRFNLLSSRDLSAETIYLTRLPNEWKDPPSSLLLVNRQIRIEVLDMVRNYPISLRITHQGTHFDRLAETCFIAQRCSKNYAKISHLLINIWPPHPDRPTDVIDIWRQLRKLRKEFRDIPQLQHVSFHFVDNEMAIWTRNGRALSLLGRDHDTPLVMDEINDVTEIMELFARVRAAKAFFHLPRGLTPDETTENIRDFLRYTNAAIMGRFPIDEDIYSEEDEEQTKLQDKLDEDMEIHLQWRGAKIARNKLDAMTKHGRHYLSKHQWDRFMAIWSPHFGSLYPGEFKGMWHYVDKAAWDDYHDDW